MLRDWLRPPVFDDDEQTRQAHIVHYFALVLVACLVITELYGERPLETRLALGSELVCVLIILILNHRGFQRGSVTLLAVSPQVVTVTAAVPVAAQSPSIVLPSPTVPPATPLPSGTPAPSP